MRAADQRVGPHDRLGRRARLEPRDQGIGGAGAPPQHLRVAHAGHRHELVLVLSVVLAAFLGLHRDAAQDRVLEEVFDQFLFAALLDEGRGARVLVDAAGEGELDHLGLEDHRVEHEEKGVDAAYAASQRGGHGGVSGDELTEGETTVAGASQNPPGVGRAELRDLRGHVDRDRIGIQPRDWHRQEAGNRPANVGRVVDDRRARAREVEHPLDARRLLGAPEVHGDGSAHRHQRRRVDGTPVHAPKKQVSVGVVDHVGDPAGLDCESR